MIDEEVLNSQEQTPVSHNNSLDSEAEYVNLPSGGVYYKGKFKGLDKLLVRKLNWTDEDILTTKSFYENGTLYDVLLKRVIIDENKFNPLDLVTIDRDAILWWLRIGAFGKEYTVPMKCKNKKDDGAICNYQIKATWDLAEFEIPDLKEEYAEEIHATGGVVITLPHTQLKCKVTVPSIGRVKEISKQYSAKKTKEKILYDFNNTIQLLSVIEEVYSSDGQTISNRTEIYQWLMKANNNKPLPMIDTRYIIKKAKEISLKIETAQDIICPDCNHVEEGVEMGMSIQFFWPDFEEM